MRPADTNAPPAVKRRWTSRRPPCDGGRVATRPRWILELDPDFPAPAQVAPLLPDAVILQPAVPGLERWPDVPAPHVAYGTMATLTRMRRHRPLAGAVFDDYPALRCSAYYRAVYDLLGRAAVIAPMAALAHLPLARMFGERVFVRSDSNFKHFAAASLDAADAPRFADARRAHWDELVVVSEVIDPGEEFRCFCRDGRAFCHSAYPREPWGPAPPEVVAFAEGAARRILEAGGPNMVTVDVGAGRDRMRLIEVGGVNSWGLYGSDPDAFIAAMEAEALARIG
jgi:hypothetical protein